MKHLVMVGILVFITVFGSLAIVKGIRACAEWGEPILLYHYQVGSAIVPVFSQDCLRRNDE